MAEVGPTMPCQLYVSVCKNTRGRNVLGAEACSPFIPPQLISVSYVRPYAESALRANDFLPIWRSRMACPRPNAAVSGAGRRVHSDSTSNLDFFLRAATAGG